MAGLNAPPTNWRYQLDEEEKKVEVEEDTKIPNAAKFIFNKEDHTLAGMLKSQLLLNDNVHFAGYKVPHPLEPRFEMSVQTDGSVTPWQAMNQACIVLQDTLGNIRVHLSKELDRYKTFSDEPYEPDVMAGL